MYDELEANRFIVFKIGDHLLALPITDVLRVVNCPPLTSKGLRTMGLMQLGQHTIKVLDLYQQLSSDRLQELPLQRFLVITRDPVGELCGILVDEPPNLMELSPEMMRSLPKSEHSNNSALAIVSHVAVIPLETCTTTIFLLDMQRVLKTAFNEIHTRALKLS